MSFAIKLCLALVMILNASYVWARGEYLSPEQFLKSEFDQQVPESHVVWLKGNVSKTVSSILGHRYNGLRIRYWQKGRRTAWVLNEIGKEQPITFGVLVADHKIQQITVLAYREDRGEQIRSPAFTNQFTRAGLNNLKLDRQIDGISGATLSVRAMTNIARLALYLDNHINDTK